MSMNPYAAPAEMAMSETVAPVATKSIDVLHRMSRHYGRLQMAVIVFMFAFLTIVLAPSAPEAVEWVLVIAGLVIWALLVLLSFYVYHGFAAVSVAVLFKLPLINFLVFLAVRDRTVRVLRQHGFVHSLLGMQISAENEQHLRDQRLDLIATIPKLRRTNWFFIVVILVLLASFLLLGT